MRKFKLQTQITLDGYMGGPNGEMDWAHMAWSEDLDSYVTALTEPVDCIVLGRKLAEGFIPHWAAQPENEPQEAIDKMNATHKVVISKTILESPWENAEVASDLVSTIDRLKGEPGGDIIAYGGGTLVASLIAEELLDELHLIVNPTAIGQGIPVFPSGDSYLGFDLLDARRFECGVAAIRLEPKRR